MTLISKAFSLDLDAILNLDILNEIMTMGHSRVSVYYQDPMNIIGSILWSEALGACCKVERMNSLMKVNALGEDKLLAHLNKDNVRNQLIQFELLLTAATFVVAIFGVVAGIFGMNFPIPFFDNAIAFRWVLSITGVTGIIIFYSFLWFFRYKRLMPL